jgi:hypothetical protein
MYQILALRASCQYTAFVGVKMLNDRPVLIASAVGLSGYFTRPESIVLPTQAAASVGSAGGIDEAKAQPFVMPGLVQIAASSATASGTVLPDGTIVILADASVTAGDVLGILRFSSIRATLRVEVKDKRRTATATVAVEGLAVANHALSVTYSVERPQLCIADLPTSPERIGSVALKWAEKSGPDVKLDGSSITIPDFGTVHFGETLRTPTGWLLTAVRVQLGSPVAGVLSFGSATAGALFLPGDPTTPIY